MNKAHLEPPPITRDWPKPRRATPIGSVVAHTIVTRAPHRYEVEDSYIKSMRKDFSLHGSRFRITKTNTFTSKGLQSRKHSKEL